MLDARRAERSYFLLRDPQYLQANRDALTRLREVLEKIRDLASSEQGPTQVALENLRLYEQQFIGAEAFADAPDSTAIGRVQEVVRAYEKDLNDLLKQARRRTRTQMIEDLRTQVEKLEEGYEVVSGWWKHRIDNLVLRKIP